MRLLLLSLCVSALAADIPVTRQLEIQLLAQRIETISFKIEVLEQVKARQTEKLNVLISAVCEEAKISDKKKCKVTLSDDKVTVEETK